MTNDTTTPGAGEELKRTPHVFLDCDGVLADFDRYAEAYFGMPSREYEAKVGSKRFWAELEAKGDFYRDLPLMADAKALFEGVKHLNPTILTGCPRGNWAQGQKVAWAAEHFPGVPIITCRSADKRDYAKPGDVLIDDWAQHRHRWIEMGGVFITHHCAETSLAALWAHYPALRATASVTTASGNEEVAATVSPPIREAKNPVPTRPVAGEGETKPVGYLKEWTELGLPLRRVDQQASHEAWLSSQSVKVTPLYAAPPPPAEAWKPDREAVARLVLPDAWVRGRSETQESMTRRRAWSLGQANAILALQSPVAQTRDQRQAQAFDWMSAAFGPQTIVQRGVRLAEEAIEAAQAADVPRDMLHKLIDHIYDRPAGDLRQELGGVGVTLLGLAAAAGLSADEGEAAELARVLAKPLAFFAARNAAKNDAGFNADLPTPAKGGDA